jgi:hypothetical protein
MTTVVMKSNYFGTPHPRNLPFLPTCPLRLAFSPTHLGVATQNLRTTPTPNRVKSIPVHQSPRLAVRKLKKSGEILQPSKDRKSPPIIYPGVWRRLTSWHHQLQTRRWIHTHSSKAHLQSRRSSKSYREG